MDSYNLIRSALDASALRKNVISNNIANINTKGYKRHDVKFEDFLDNSALSLKRTKENHLPSLNQKAQVYVDSSTSLREDGNNVDLEIEKTNQAANTLMYNALITQLNGKLSLQNYIISGGR